MKNIALIFNSLPTSAKANFSFTAFVVTISSILEVCVIYLINQFNKESNSIFIKEFQLDINNYIVFIITCIILAFVFKMLSNILIHHSIQSLKYMYNKTILRSFLISKNSRSLSKERDTIQREILSEVEFLADQIYLPVLRFFSALILASIISIYLLLVDFKVAFLSLLALCGAYAIMYSISRGLITRLGSLRTISNEKRVNVLDSILYNYFELRLYSKEVEYATVFEGYANDIAKTRKLEVIISESPRIIIEYLLLGIILVASLHFLATGSSDPEGLSTYLAFAYAGFKLIPAIQHVYFAFVRINFSEGVLKHFSKYKNVPEYKVKDRSPKTIAKSKKQTIMLKLGAHNLRKLLSTNADNFEADNDIQEMLLSKGDWLHVRGQSGVGKSLIFENALFETIDDTFNEDELSLSMVTQSISLLNTTILENITLQYGVNPSRCEDLTTIFSLMRLVNLVEFATKDRVTQSINVLSGGQKQRILIARALYFDADLIIYDESFSGLDKEMRNSIFANMKSQFPDKIIVNISHDPISVNFFNKLLTVTPREQREIKREVL